MLDYIKTRNNIKFRKIGHFKVLFKVNAYIKKNGTNFDSNQDFVALGFKQKDSDNIILEQVRLYLMKYLEK